jgi:secretion/DNA translocation related TadE-like protein
VKPGLRDEVCDEGSGTVLVVALVAVVVVLAGLLGAVVSGQSASARGRAAADLAALGAAARIAAPPGIVLDEAAIEAADPCGTARKVAERNGTGLSACTVVGDGVVEVRVTVRTSVGPAVVSARAGPRARARPGSGL